jgi:flagellar assembly protein FliH
MTQSRPFQFDTDFGDGAHVIPSARRKRVYVADEVDVLVEAARREGEASAMAQAEAARAHALKQIADAARAGLSVLTESAFAHKQAAAELALIAARKIAGGALEMFPGAPIEAALGVLAREIEAAPRLVIRLSDSDAELQEIIEEAARDGGFAGQIAFKSVPGAPTASFALEWPDGRAGFDPEAAAQQVSDAIHAALAADENRGEGFSPDPTGAY